MRLQDAEPREFAKPERAQPFFYRTAGGAGIDLLLAWPDGSLWAIEIKRSLAPGWSGASTPPAKT